MVGTYSGSYGKHSSFHISLVKRYRKTLNTHRPDAVPPTPDGGGRPLGITMPPEGSLTA